MSSVQESQSSHRELSSELSESPVASRELSSELIESPASDRELYSELSEPPIKPALLHMCAPRKNEALDYQLQVNGEALWKWRNIRSSSELFDVVQDELAKIGYRLSPSSRPRLGENLKKRVDYFAQKSRSTKNGNVRKAMRADHWCTIAISPGEIAQGPRDVINQLRNAEELAGRLEGETKMQTLTRSSVMMTNISLVFRV